MKLRNQIMILLSLTMLLFPLGVWAFAPTPQPDTTPTWTVRFVDSGTITETKLYPNPYPADTGPGYYFEIDNETVIKVAWAHYERWGVGDYFRYYNTEVVNDTEILGLFS